MNTKEHLAFVKKSMQNAYGLGDELFTHNEEQGVSHFYFYSEEPDFNNKRIMVMFSCIDGLNRSCFLRIIFLPDITNRNRLFQEVNELNKTISIPEKYSWELIEGVDSIIAIKEVWHNGDNNVITTEFSNMLSRMSKDCQVFMSKQGNQFSTSKSSNSQNTNSDQQENTTGNGKKVFRL